MTVKIRLLGSLVMSAAFLLIASGTGAQAADKTTLVALVAPNAKTAFLDIAKLYEKLHPDITIDASYVGSKIIAAQIASGAAADVVVIAQPNFAAASSGLDTPVVVYRNRTAIGVNKSAAAKVKDAKDLAKPGVHIAGGTPGSTVAVNESEAVAKLSAHYGKDFQAKYDANVVTKRTDSLKLTDAVQSGAVDAAIVYESNIDTNKLIMIKLSGEDAVIAPYVVAPVKASTHGAQAKEFATFIAGSEAASILRLHHQEAAN